MTWKLFIAFPTKLQNYMQLLSVLPIHTATHRLTKPDSFLIVPICKVISICFAIGLLNRPRKIFCRLFRVGTTTHLLQCANT